MRGRKRGEGEEERADIRSLVRNNMRTRLKRRGGAEGKERRMQSEG